MIVHFSAIIFNYIFKNAAAVTYFVVLPRAHYSYFCTPCRCGHADCGQAHKPDPDALASVVVRAVHQRDESEQVGGGGLHPGRSVVVRPGAVRELLPRVFRRHRPQIRRPTGAAAAVLGEREGVAVAEQPVRSGLHTGHVQPVRVQHDVRAAGLQRRGRVLLHRGQPRVLPAQAPTARRPVLRVPGTRAQARPDRHTAQHIADAGQQPPGDRLARAHGAHLRERGRHALRAAQATAPSNDIILSLQSHFTHQNIR